METVVLLLSDVVDNDDAYWQAGHPPCHQVVWLSCNIVLASITGRYVYQCHQNQPNINIHRYCLRNMNIYAIQCNYSHLTYGKPTCIHHQRQNVHARARRAAVPALPSV
jgi:hypothetical protein